MNSVSIEKNMENRDATNFIDSRFFKIALIFIGVIFAPIVANIMGLWEKSNPLLVNVILLTGFFLFLFLISKSIDNKIIPYFLLQYAGIWINLNQITFIPAGVDFKPYAIVFVLSSIVTFYYILTNFKYLWKNFAFKCLMLFLMLNLFYAFFYSSDFRSSSYIDSWIENNAGLKQILLGAGYGAATREFGVGETQFLKYLTGIVPLVAFVIGYMSFYGLKTLEETKKKFNDIIKMLSVGYIAYFVILILCILAGTASMVFWDNRLRINDNFTGVDFEGLFLLLSIGFSLYISNFRPVGIPLWLKQIININIIVLSLLIILGIKKGTIISFLAGFMVIQLGSFFFKEKNKTAEASPAYKNLLPLALILILPLIAVLPFFLTSQDFIGDTIYNVTDRFSSTSTLEVREINWYHYMNNWASNLTWFTAIFGFGTDTSREVSFFLSAMHPDKGLQQPHIHNIYLEYFYNWGLMALLYFLPMLIILVKDIYEILNKSVTKVIKLFSAVNIACIVFFLLFFLAESPSMVSHITFFALLGFFESLKISWQNTSAAPQQ